MGDLPDADFVGERIVPGEALEMHRGIDLSDMRIEGGLAVLRRRREGDMAVRRGHRAVIIVERVGVLAVDAVRWKFGLIHAGVAGALEEQLRIDREDERLVPDAAGLGQRRLRLFGGVGVAEERTRIGVVDGDDIVPAELDPARAGRVEGDRPPRDGWERELPFAVVEGRAEYQAVAREAHLLLGTGHPEVCRLGHEDGSFPVAHGLG
jgi:hypothetical protein